MKQHTLKAPFFFEGKGLHTGLHIHATFLPAEENTGVRICRTDLEGRPTYEAVADYVTATERGLPLLTISVSTPSVMVNLGSVVLESLLPL